jgi:iron complex outermembrane receptor protein
MMMQKTTLSLMVAACFVSTGAMADEGKLLAPVVVTATRVEQDSFDLPMSIDKVEKENIQDGQLRMTLSESLARVPGITAQSRTQMAQDPQISSRGFGARSSFGVRGLRVYVDGIPLSMPDGIGNPGSVDLDVIGGIEVMRGPFSAMYGNSSGGVIQMLTEKAPATPEVTGDVLFGSFNTHRESTKAAGTKDGVEYLVDYSDYSSDGYRKQSKNDKQQATVKLGTQIGDDAKLTTLISWFDQFAQDPGGLSRVASAGSPSVFQNPTATTNGAVLANSRVLRSNTQIGFNYEKSLDVNNTLNIITYAGQRDNLQYLSTIATTNAGRASSINREFSGTEARLTNKGNFLDKPYVISYGLNFGSMEDARKDQPAAAGQITGAGAAATRNETQTATNFDQYAQGMWSFADRWDLHAGIRHTNLDLKIMSNIVTSGSGALNFSKTIPVVGLTFKATPMMNFYANIGQGFETPTLTEITYANPSNTAAGANLAIKPSTSTNFEIGSKIMVSDSTKLNVALFEINTNNEIVVDQLVSTTASYKNAGKTKRDGLEISAESKLTERFSVFGAYTLLNATFDTPFTTNGNTIAAGNKIPGTYRTQLYAEAAWKYQPLNFQTALETRFNSKTYVDDRNTDIAGSYAIFNVRASLSQTINKLRITEYARVDNVFDRSYIGSVRVNDTNSRFYEAAPGRNWIAGVKANYAF